MSGFSFLLIWYLVGPFLLPFDHVPGVPNTWKGFLEQGFIVSVEVPACQWAPVVSHHNTIRVQHWHNLHLTKCRKKLGQTNFKAFLVKKELQRTKKKCAPWKQSYPWEFQHRPSLQAESPKIPPSSRIRWFRLDGLVPSPPQPSCFSHPPCCSL